MLEHSSFLRSRHFHCAPLPDPDRGKFRESDFPASDVGWMYAGEVRKLCARLSSEGRRVAAFIAEAVMHQCGHVEMPDRYLQEVKT